MLLVRTRVCPSAIHGLGLFAVDRIAAGSAVWRFTPVFDLDLDPQEIASLPADWRGVLLHYGYVDVRLERYILCCDDARFINHSAFPNLASTYVEDRHGIDRAIRDISPGEELTIDYRSVEGRSTGRRSAEDNR